MKYSPIPLLFMLAAACAPKPPDAPMRPTDDPAFANPTTSEKPGIEEDAATADGLRAGDLLSVRYVGNKDVEPQSVIIDRGGAIHLPLAGDVVVEGATVSEAEGRVLQSLRRYDLYSTVSITLVETRGRLATVNGAVEHPGNVPIVGDAHLADVLAAAGGPKMASTNERATVLGDMDAARVVRDGRTLPIDVGLALEGAPRHNVRVHPGDVIYVPPALDGRIVVLGHVNKPQTLTFRHGMRLTEVLADCGGLTKDSDSEDVRIVRGGFAHPRLYVANAKDVLTALRPDVILAPGDVVYVTEHWFASVGDVLDRIVPAAATAAVVAAVH